MSVKIFIFIKKFFNVIIVVLKILRKVLNIVEICYIRFSFLQMMKNNIEIYLKKKKRYCINFYWFYYEKFKKFCLRLFYVERKCNVNLVKYLQNFLNSFFFFINVNKNFYVFDIVF